MPIPPSINKYQILGVSVSAITIEDALTYITQKAADPKSSACYIVKPYVEFLTLAYKNSIIQSILNQGVLCLPDGVALNWAAYFLYGGKRTLHRFMISLGQIIFKPSIMYRVLPARFAGINFTLPLIKRCAKYNLKLFLVGSPKNQTIVQTAKFLQLHYPKLNIVGTAEGNLNDKKKQNLINTLQSTCPDIVLVGMGFPKQEILMAEIVPYLQHGIMIGEGGTFDYREFGGNIKRAPKFFQTIGLEWLWRLAKEPSRFKRQVAVLNFIKEVWSYSKKS